MNPLILTFWICKLTAAGTTSPAFFGSGTTKAEAELNAAKACFDDGNVACVVRRCGSEKVEEDQE